MNLFKSFTLLWWQTGLFKLSLIALGILLGSTWPDLFRRWRGVLLLLFLLPAVYLAGVWWQQ